MSKMTEEMLPKARPNQRIGGKWTRLVLATALVLILAGPDYPAVARSSVSNGDDPWNARHVGQLPSEIQNALAKKCGPSLRATHYFVTYFQDAQLIKLHFEHLRCGAEKRICTEAGCLHQEYILRAGHFRLLKSYYAPDSD